MPDNNELTPHQREVISLLKEHEGSRIIPLRARDPKAERRYALQYADGYLSSQAFHSKVIFNLHRKGNLVRMGKDGQIFYVLPLPEIISATDGNIVAREGSQADLFLTGSPFVDKIEINFATEAAKNWHNYTLPPKPERILKTDL